MWTPSPASHSGQTTMYGYMDQSREEYELHRSQSPGPDVPLNSVTRGLRRVAHAPTPTPTLTPQQIWFSMSSPTSSGEYPPAKRRRMSPNQGHSYDPSGNNGNNGYSPTSSGGPSGGQGQLMGPSTTTHSINGQAVILQQAIPKRGARACTACRKGKNRCEGEVSGPFSPFAPPTAMPHTPQP